MAVANDDIIRVSCRMLVDGTDEIANVFHIKVLDNGTGDDTDIKDEIGLWFSLAYAEFQANQPNNLTPNVIDLYNVTQDVPMGQIPWSGGFTGGSATGSMMPLNDSVLVLWLTGAKRVQGKTYLGPLTTGNMGDGVWASGPIDAAHDFAEILQVGETGGTGTIYQFGIYSRNSGLFHTITGRRVQPIPAVQRRRKRGRGS